MSTCIEDNILIRLVAGELSIEQREQAMGHLAGCASCRQRVEETQATWDTLGQWQVAVPEKDLSAAVITAAARARRDAPLSWLRIAAAIALAAGLGSAVGFLVPARSRQTVSVQTVSGQELAEQIGLDELGRDSSGLADLFSVEPGSDSKTEEGQS